MRREEKSHARGMALSMLHQLSVRYGQGWLLMSDDQQQNAIAALLLNMVMSQMAENSLAAVQAAVRDVREALNAMLAKESKR